MKRSNSSRSHLFELTLGHDVNFRKVWIELFIFLAIPCGGAGAGPDEICPVDEHLSHLSRTDDTHTVDLGSGGVVKDGPGSLHGIPGSHLSYPARYKGLTPQKLIQSFSGLELTGKLSKKSIFIEMKEVANSDGFQQLNFVVRREGVKVGTGRVYLARGNIADFHLNLDSLAHGDGIAEAMVQRFFDLSPSGTRMEYESINEATSKELRPILEDIVRNSPFKEASEKKGLHQTLKDHPELSRTVSRELLNALNAMPLAERPLWVRVNTRVGWKLENIEVDLSHSDFNSTEHNHFKLRYRKP